MTPRMLLASLGVACTWVACVNGQDEGYSYVAGHTSFGRNSENSRGFVDAMIMTKDSRPIIAFGAQKRPADKGRFTFIILFSSKHPKGGFSVDVAGKTDGGKDDSADVTTKFKLNSFTLDVAYAYTSDPKSGELSSEKLKLNGEEVVTTPPQVFLAVQDGDQTKLKPVKVKVTTLPPDLGAENKDAYPFYLGQTIDALKKDSAEIAEFLKK